MAQWTRYLLCKQDGQKNSGTHKNYKQTLGRCGNPPTRLKATWLVSLTKPDPGSATDPTSENKEQLRKTPDVNLWLSHRYMCTCTHTWPQINEDTHRYIQTNTQEHKNPCPGAQQTCRACQTLAYPETFKRRMCTWRLRVSEDRLHVRHNTKHSMLHRRPACLAVLSLSLQRSHIAHLDLHAGCSGTASLQQKQDTPRRGGTQQVHEDFLSCSGEGHLRALNCRMLGFQAMKDKFHNTQREIYLISIIPPNTC